MRAMTVALFQHQQQGKQTALQLDRGTYFEMLSLDLAEIMRKPDLADIEKESLNAMRSDCDAAVRMMRKAGL